MVELLADLLKKQAELQRGTFDSAPDNWAEFNRRLGVSIGLQVAIDLIKDILEGDDHDQ